MQVVLTADGSNTLFNSHVGEHYHSTHGAVQESKHVFVTAGFKHYLSLFAEQKEISILEVGFGTGLNFLLTAEFVYNSNYKLSYTGIEAYPIPLTLVQQMGYGEYINSDLWERFCRCYSQTSGNFRIQQGINLTIINSDVLDYDDHSTKYDIIYFDAFGAGHQPEMWNEQTLAHVCQFIKRGGVFVTYAITGNLKRTLKKLGFAIEKLPGAPGKREMLRATMK